MTTEILSNWFSLLSSPSPGLHLNTFPKMCGLEITPNVNSVGGVVRSQHVGHANEWICQAKGLREYASLSCPSVLGDAARSPTRSLCLHSACPSIQNDEKYTSVLLKFSQVTFSIIALPNRLQQSFHPLTIDYFPMVLVSFLSRNSSDERGEKSANTIQ